MEINIGAWMANRRHQVGKVLAEVARPLTLQLRCARVLMAARDILPDDLADDIGNGVANVLSLNASSDEPEDLDPLEVAYEMVAHRRRSFDEWAECVTDQQAERVCKAMAKAWDKEGDR